MTFLRCQTQWRYAGDPPAHVGLDMAAVIAVMAAAGVPEEERADTLARVQVMESEAIAVLGRARQRSIDKVNRERRAAAAKRGGRR